MRSPLVSQSGHVSNGNNFGGGHYHASGHYSFCNKENICQSHQANVKAMGITSNPGRSISVAESSIISLLILEVNVMSAPSHRPLLPAAYIWRSYSSRTLTITTQVFSIVSCWFYFSHFLTATIPWCLYLYLFFFVVILENLILLAFNN